MANIDIQVATRHEAIPAEDRLRAWCRSALAEGQEQAELTVRIVDEAEIHALNRQFRNKDKPTNVLSFPSELPPTVKAELLLLGDIVICAKVVAREAAEQGKTAEAHWAHMIVHGTLHLQGYDHIDEAEALEMEALETHILEILGFPAPYHQDTGT